MSGNDQAPGDGERDGAKAGPQSLLDLLLRGAQTKLDDLREPTAAELAALDGVDEVEETAPALDAPVDLQPALAAMLLDIEEPELVSLESLDDADAADEEPEELDNVDELLEDVEELIEDYIDVDLDDAELEDEGYDLDDDEVQSYHDLYGADDTIVPSFREGEYAEEEEGDTAYYDDLR